MREKVLSLSHSYIPQNLGCWVAPAWGPIPYSFLTPLVPDQPLKKPIKQQSPQKTSQGSDLSPWMLKTMPTSYVRPGLQTSHVSPPPSQELSRNFLILLRQIKPEFINLAWYDLLHHWHYSLPGAWNFSEQSSILYVGERPIILFVIWVPVFLSWLCEIPISTRLKKIPSVHLTSSWGHRINTSLCVLKSLLNC